MSSYEHNPSQHLEGHGSWSPTYTQEVSYPPMIPSFPCSDDGHTQSQRDFTKIKFTPSDIQSQTLDQSSSNTRASCLKIVGLFLAALAISLCHHAFNKHLDGHIVHQTPINSWKNVYVYSQRGASAMGTAFALGYNTCLGISFGTSFTQYAWRVVSRRAHSVESISVLFSGRSDVIDFLSRRFFRTARLGAVVIFLSWCIPFIAIFTPGSLSVMQSIVTTNNTCTVPRLDLSQSPYLLYGGKSHQSRKKV